MKTKKCTECNKIKFVNEFHKSFRDGYRSKCKVCRSKLNCKPKEIKECLICKKIFTAKYTSSKYCSNYCKHKAASNNFRNKQKTKKCKICGKEFKPYTTLTKYCSKKCFYKAEEYNRKGTNNPSYRNGNYIKGVKRTAIGETIFIKNKKEIIQSMIDDVGYKYCQYCNTTNTLRFESHHIIFRSEKPLHKYLHHKRNIIYLCIQCHNDFHKNKGLRNEIVKDRKLNELFGNDVLNKRITDKKKHRI